MVTYFNPIKEKVNYGGVKPQQNGDGLFKYVRIISNVYLLYRYPHRDSGKNPAKC